MKTALDPNKNWRVSLRLQIYRLGLAHGHLLTLKRQGIGRRDPKMRRAVSRLRMFSLRVARIRAERIEELAAEL